MNSFETLPGKIVAPYYLVRLPVAVGCPYGVVQAPERYGIGVSPHG